MKFKNAVLNIITYGMLGWGALSAIYLGLPEEIKELLPNMNWVTAVVSGGSTTLLGSISLYIKGYVNKTKLATNEVYLSISNMMLEHKAEFNNIVENGKEIVNAYKEMTEATLRNNELLETLLETKLSNPLIDEASAKLINDILGKEVVEDEVENNL